MKKNLLVVFFLFTVLAVLGQKDGAKRIVNADTIGFSEAQAYKMLYENQIKSNDAILKTIFYALGGLATAIIAVFASNWWFNEDKIKQHAKGIDRQINETKNEAFNEVRERVNAFSIEKNSEINNLKIKLTEDFNNNISNLQSRLTEFIEKTRVEIRDDNKSLTDNYQKQLDSFNENYRQQIETLNENIVNFNGSLKQIIELKEEALRLIISDEEKRRNIEVNRLWAKISRTDYYMWKDSGVTRNAAMSLIEEINYTQKAGSSNFELSLRQFSAVLDTCKDFYDFDKEEAIEVINSLPQSEDVDKYKKEIFDKLDKIKITPTRIKTVA